MALGINKVIDSNISNVKTKEEIQKEANDILKDAMNTGKHKKSTKKRCNPKSTTNRLLDKLQHTVNHNKDDCPKDKKNAKEKILGVLVNPSEDLINPTTNVVYAKAKTNGLDGKIANSINNEISSATQNIKVRSALTLLDKVLCNDPMGGLSGNLALLDALNGLLFGLSLGFINCPIDPKKATSNMLGMAVNLVNPNMTRSDNIAFKNTVNVMKKDKFEVGAAANILTSDLTKQKIKESFTHDTNSDIIKVSNSTKRSKHKTTSVALGVEILGMKNVIKKDNDFLDFAKLEAKSTTNNKTSISTNSDMSIGQKTIALNKATKINTKRSLGIRMN